VVISYGYVYLVFAPKVSAVYSRKTNKQTDELTEKKSTDAILCRETEELERQRMKVT
jgi:hypothetical protein